MHEQRTSKFVSPFQKIKTYNLDKLSKYSIVSSQVSEVKSPAIPEQKVAEQSIVNKGNFWEEKIIESVGLLL